MRLVAAALLAAMAGCAVAAEEVPVRGGGACDASKVQKLIGRSKSSKLGSEALRLSGARVLRWIGPRTAVTMDLRQDRLNLRLDRRNRLVRVDCA